ncbi:AbrB family transcriptional regulator [Ornithinibacillus halophilus]|uniref:Membrane protein AbrB duplication n=1 Tax=Ornithinibacillus halophilus TaxID=930117 RepID=A0A1M5J6Y4_9BACI|nr:AbrB family transcriptional regulator [Ornithinibacillus halophilus]SHG36302.1 hypothetical protein SAMN05216225_102834 [Ornithinibacillus halophilus]
MKKKQVFSIVETIIIAFLGGMLFYFIQLPLPWVLGSLIAVSLWQGFFKRKMVVPEAIKNGGFAILGISFGLYFTAETFQTILPYLIPYLLLTIVLIVVSVVLGFMVTKWIKIDPVTSVFSCIPGGLSEMALASESLSAKSSLVVIFQTIRLLTVLFTIPAAMTLIFAGNETELVEAVATNSQTTSILEYMWFFIPAIIALLIKDKLPAGIIIGALGITAIMNVSGIQLPTLPQQLIILGQIAVGASLGKKILFRDLKLGGKLSFYYLGLSLLIILTSAGLGLLLAYFSPLSVTTSILSIAPGGLFEMVITATEIGGDPAIVSALQLMRILIIVLFVPPVLGWFFRRKPPANLKLDEIS